MTWNFSSEKKKSATAYLENPVEGRSVLVQKEREGSGLSTSRKKNVFRLRREVHAGGEGEETFPLNVKVKRDVRQYLRGGGSVLRMSPVGGDEGWKKGGGRWFQQCPWVKKTSEERGMGNKRALE